MGVGRGVGWCGVVERGSVAGSGDALYDRGDGGSSWYEMCMGWTVPDLSQGGLEHSYSWAAIGRDGLRGEKSSGNAFC
jgi:hypothetical protein